MTGALILLLLLSPALLAAAAAVAATSAGPVLQRADRVGRGGRAFTMFTFRTKRAGTVTAVGHVLHRHFLDRLPQLFNVLRGDMSLVGPLPLAAREADAKGPGTGRARLAVRPGITGLWQVSARSDLPWEEMTVLDLHYVEQHWLGLDLLILARTVPAVVAGRRPTEVMQTAPVRVA